MAQENAEIIILSPDDLDTCFLPTEHEGRFWLYRKDKDGKKPVAEIWGKEDGWYLLKNKLYQFPQDGKESYLLTFDFRLYLQSKEGEYCLIYHPIPSTSHIHYALKKEQIYHIGRGEDQEIVIKDNMISYHHAQLSFHQGKWQIFDLHSRNGTYVNAKRVTQQQLNPGDRIQMMQYLIVMGKDTLLIMAESQLSQVLEPCIPLSQKSIGAQRKKILPSAMPKKTLEPLNVELEPPMSVTETKKMPLILTTGPSFTMGMSSMAMGLLSVYQAKMQHQSLQSVLPTLLMSCSMAITMMVWPIILHYYEQHQQKKEKQKQECDYLTYLKELEEQLQSYMKEEEESRKVNYDDSESIQDKLKYQPWLMHERLPQDDSFLFISMGKTELTASIHITSTKSPLSPPKDASWKAYQDFKNHKFLLPTQTFCLDMKLWSHIGVYGEHEVCLKFLIDKVMQIFLLQHRQFLHICMIIHTEDSYRYAIRTLPALYYGSHRLLVCEKEDGKEVDLALREWWKQRLKQEYLVIVSFDRSLEERLDCLSMLLHEEHVVYIQSAKSMQQLHPECELMISLNEYEKIKINDHVVTPSYMSDVVSKTLMHQYHRLEFIEKQHIGFPIQFTFLDMYQCGNVAQLGILQRWKKMSTSLEACVGINEHEEIIKLDLHEQFHGPHGLIAGMTGSGKSEWLITLILSLAIQHAPNDISFVLIDYKGGGMAQAFAQLPHVAGILTNLDDEQIQRAIQGIRQELTRRQALFRNCQKAYGKNVMHIDQYRQLWSEGFVKERLSHIVIVSDEFAELKQQQPAFMEDLKQIARIGRSLGIHLLLATQKPNGVIDDQIWSNARFHVCLKVQDRMDSMEMLKKEDAIYLKEAGMFYLQIGYDEHYVKGKAAWANAPYVEKEEYKKKTNQNLSVISTTGTILYEKELSSCQSAEKKQLEAIVSYLHALAKQYELMARALWLSPLDETITKKELVLRYHDEAVIAEIDDPANQRKLPLRFSLDKLAQIAVIASREEDHQIMLEAMLSAIDQEHTYLYLLKDGDLDIGALGVDDEILYHEEEKWQSYLYVLQQELEQRKRKRSNLTIFSIFQHFEAFLSSGEERKDALFQLAREGSKYGIYFCFMMQSPYTMTYQMKGFLSTVYCFYLEESDGYLGLFHSNDGIKIGKQLGRGMLEKEQMIYQFQCASDITLSQRKRKSRMIPLLPKRVYDQKKHGYLFIGLDVISKEPVWLSEKDDILILCSFSFYQPFEKVMKQYDSISLLSIEELTIRRQEENIKKALIQGSVLWNGSGYSQACYALNLPYLPDQGLDERMGVLWKNGNHQIIRLVEEIENG